MLRKTLIILAMIFLGFILWWTATLPVWQIESVEISGNDYIPLNLLQTKADNFIGSSIWFVTEKDINFDLFLVENYKIQRRFFPARIILALTTREPLLAVTVNGQYCIVDAQGVVLNQGGIAVPSANLLRVAPLKGLNELEYLIKNLLPLCDLLNNIYQYPDLLLNISNRNNIQVLVKDRLLLKFGQAVDFEQKYAALVSVLADVKPQLAKIQYIDVSSYKTPAVK